MSSEQKEEKFGELLKEKWSSYDWNQIAKRTACAAVFAVAGGTLGHYGYDIEENTNRLETEFNTLLKEELNIENLSEDLLNATELIAEQVAKKERITQRNQTAFMGSLFSLIK